MGVQEMPKNPCADPRCPKLVPEWVRYCHDHRGPKAGDRPSAHKRGYTRHWRKARLAHLRKHPLCCDPFGVHFNIVEDVEAFDIEQPRLRNSKKVKVHVAANTVDHAIPHRGDGQLFWEADLWASVCLRCHSIKTRTVDPYIRGDIAVLQTLLLIGVLRGLIATVAVCRAVCSHRNSGKPLVNEVEKVVSI